MTEPNEVSKQKRERSPSYPAIDLKSAIEKLQSFYTKEKGRHYVPITAILGHWGFTPKSGYGLVVFAALKKFGLLQDQGNGENRQAKLTDLAMAILVPHDEAERLKSIKEAALLPNIHAQLWAQYSGQLPSDATLKALLIRQDPPFNPSSVDEFISEFRTTIEFANLQKSGTISEEKPEEKIEKRDTDNKNKGGGDLFTQLFNSPVFSPAKEPEKKMPVAEEKTRMSRIYQIPLPNDQLAAVQLPVDLSEDEWKMFLGVLSAMEPGLVKKKAADKTSNPQIQVKRGLTDEAVALLKKVESGGVPMYMNDGLTRIALDNGVIVSPTDTPEQVIKTLREIHARSIN